MKHRRPRRYFKTTEIALMRKLAAEGKSQTYVARLLDRNPGTIAQAGKRYGIYFHAETGRPKLSPEEKEIQRIKRVEACRRWRARKAGKPVPKISTKTPVYRFDDPRVMV